MNVLVIPEDFRKDQYILKPIVKAMLARLNQPRANIRVCQDPLLGGIGQALKWERIEEILKRYRMVDLFLLIVDRDGKAGRRNALNRLEGMAPGVVTHRSFFLAENAWQEIEVWVLAGLSLPREWRWPDVRAEVDPKDVYFEPVARQRNLLDSPGQGRKVLAQEAASRYTRIRQLCPEDVQALEGRIKQHLAGVAP